MLCHVDAFELFNVVETHVHEPVDANNFTMDVELRRPSVRQDGQLYYSWVAFIYFVSSLCQRIIFEVLELNFLRLRYLTIPLFALSILSTPILRTNTAST